MLFGSSGGRWFWHFFWPKIPKLIRIAPYSIGEVASGKFLLKFFDDVLNACDPLLIRRTEQATPFDTCCLTARIGGTATFTTRLVTRTDVVASELGVARWKGWASNVRGDSQSIMVNNPWYMVLGMVFTSQKDWPLPIPCNCWELTYPTLGKSVKSWTQKCFI